MTDWQTRDVKLCMMRTPAFVAKRRPQFRGD
ncbi:hypothetical protein V1290_005544 [Bradyrhizobium sp. AZCC 1578]